MIFLLLDTSDANLLVGLADETGVIDVVCYSAWQRQSELLVNEIHLLLEKHGFSPKDIQAISCGKGPGSYTGIRIALSVAKVMAMALSVPLYLVSSLCLLRKGEGPCICLVNARSKRSYFAVYEGNRALEPDQIRLNADALSYIEAHPDYSVCGSVEYLGLASQESDVAQNLYLGMSPENLIENPIGAKPVYLKDDYDQGGFHAVVRKMLPADIKGVLEVEKEALPLDAHGEEALRYELTENPFAHLYVALVGKQIVGFIDFMITFDSATICQIAVKQAFQRKGIGNLLLGQALKDCRSQKEPVEFLTLEVRQSNEAAKRFYKKHRFEFIVVKPHYYQNGEDAEYYVRSLLNNG